MEGDLFYECVDCHRTYDQEGVSLCSLCFKTVSPFVANERHRFAAFRFRLAKDVDEKHSPLHCIECDRTYSDWNRQIIARHTHRNWELLVGSIKAEELRSRQFRQCPLRSPAVACGGARETFDMDCSWCGKGIEKRPEVTTHYCAQCSLEYCESCKASDIASHPHRLITLRTYTSDAPSDYWKDMASGEDSTHFCDSCGETISPRLSRYMSCGGCAAFDICEKCISYSRRILESHACGGGKPSVWNYYNVKGVGHEYLEKQHVLARAQKSRWKNGTDRDRRASTPSFGLQPTQVPPPRHTVPAPQAPAPYWSSQAKPGLQAFHNFQGPLPSPKRLSPPKGHRPTQSLQSFQTFQSAGSPSASSVALHNKPQQSSQQLNRLQHSPKPPSERLPRPQPSPQPSALPLRPPLATVRSAPPVIQQPEPIAELSGVSGGGVGRKVLSGVTKAMVGGVANAVGVGGIEDGVSAIEASLAARE